jgi:hypothetical protein
MGSSTTYDIVSNADTVIFLKNPCIVFAEWGPCVPSNIAGIEKVTKELSVSRFGSKKDKKKSKKIKILSSQENSSHELVVDDGRLASVETSPADNGGSSSTAIVPKESSKGIEQSVFGSEPSGIKQTVAVPDMVVAGENRNSNDLSSAIMFDTRETEAVPKTTTEPKEEEGIRFHVCAGNLMSASPWFNRALKRNGWMESNWNPEDRWFHISAQDWDEEAFVILMNVFHLRNHKVPRAITLEMLAKFAVLADYYECGESVDLMVDIWVADLRVKTPVPTTYCRDLILWMWISWTFKLSDLFKEATAVVTQQSPEPVRNLGLPIPAWMTGMYILTTSVDVAYNKQMRLTSDEIGSSSRSCPD